MTIINFFGGKSGKQYPNANQPCPECGTPMLVVQYTKGKDGKAYPGVACPKCDPEDFRQKDLR